MYHAVRFQPSSRAASSRDDVESTFVSSFGEDEEHPQHQRSRLAYKPPAIRLPTLMLYFALLALCVVLIEWALSGTYQPKPITSSFARSTKPRTLSFKRYVNDSCANTAAFSSQLQEELSVSNSLCAGYSNTFKPHTASLPPSLITAFPVWQKAMVSNQQSRQDLSIRLTGCGSLPSAVSDSETLTTIYIACDSIVTSLSARCTGGGMFSLVNNAIITNSWIFCPAMKTLGLLHLTSQTVDADLTTSDISPTTGFSAAAFTVSRISQVQDTTVILSLTSQPFATVEAIQSLASKPNKSPVPVPVSTSKSQDLPAPTQTPASQPQGSMASIPTSTSQPPAPKFDIVYTLVDSSTTIVYSYSSAAPPSQQNSQISRPASTIPFIIFTSMQPSLTSQVPNSRLTTSAPASPLASTLVSASANSHSSVSSAASLVTVYSTLTTLGPSGFVTTTIIQFSRGSSISQQLNAISSASGGLQLSSGKFGNSQSAHMSSTTQGTNQHNTVAPTGISASTISKQQISSPMVITMYSTVLPGQTIARVYSGTVVVSDSIVVPTVVTLYSIYTGTTASLATFTITNTASLEAFATYSSASKPSSTIKMVEHRIDVKYASTDVVMKHPFEKRTDYFAAMYLAPILAVVVKALWEIIAASLKMMEPFRRMKAKAGVSARYSVLTQYLSSIVSRDVFRALAHGHLLPLWTLIIYILVVAAAPIASVSMDVWITGKCTASDGTLFLCDPQWVIHKPVIRVLEGGLVICMVLMVCFTWSTRKSHITVATNPSSIASVASLMNFEPLVQDLERIDPLADESAFSTALEKHVFKLDDHQSRRKGFSRFGIIGMKRQSPDLSEPLEGAWLRTTDVSEDTAFMTADSDQTVRPVQPEPHPILYLFTNPKSVTKLIDALQLFMALALLALLVAYTVDTGNDSFNNFFNSEKALPKVILVGLATIVDIQIKALERVVRINEPFRRLACRNARPETTILLSLNGTCWSNLPQCIYLLFTYEFANGRMLWQTIVTIVASLSDFNIIATSGVIFTGAQILPALYACAYASVAITSCILLVNIVTVLWWRRVEVIREMPRQPKTIGAVMSYLCSSEFVREWMDDQNNVRAERLRSRHMAMLVRGEGRRYFFGKVPGIDGRERWCIDIDSWRDEKEAKSRAAAYIS